MALEGTRRVLRLPIGWKRKLETTQRLLVEGWQLAFHLLELILVELPLNGGAK
jgi:hypothetical protein